MIDITDKSKCSGCHACLNSCPKNCIEMVSDEEGFRYPYINKKNCVLCGKCVRVCPIMKQSDMENTSIAYAACNRNENIRRESSSGGVFTLLAEHIISQGGVVFAACFDAEFNVVHKYAERAADLSRFRGSKYVQSEIGTSYKSVKEFLDKGRLILFTGTPCQIGGLKSYLGKKYDNLYCQDIICHGVPSPKVWKKYVAYREKCAGSAARRIVFRCKDEGWKRNFVSFFFNNNTEYHQILHKDLMMHAFLKNICLRPSCYQCSFKTLNRESDITLADFWGIQKIMPEMDDDKGTSLVIINSNKGKNLFDDVKKQMRYKQTDLKQAVKYNPAMIFSSGNNPKRQAFFDDLDVLTFDYLVEKYCTDNYFTRAKRKARSILSRILGSDL